jgi:hypothetical protein
LFTQTQTRDEPKPPPFPSLIGRSTMIFFLEINSQS